MTTTYLLDFAPDGTTEVLEYTANEMEELFTVEQRANLAKGMRIIHYWENRNPRTGIRNSHAIVDMVVTAKRRWDV